MYLNQKILSTFSKITSNAKYVSFGYHSKNHGVGFHNLRIISKIPKDVVFESGVNVGFEGAKIEPDHEIRFILGKKRRKITITIKHGKNPIPLNTILNLENMISFNIDLLYNFEPILKIISFEIHMNHLSLRVEGLKNTPLNDLRNLLTFLDSGIDQVIQNKWISY